MYRIFLSLYSFIYFVTLLLSIPVLYIRRLRTGKNAHLNERLGRLLSSPDVSDQPVVWIHAVSVGEVKAIRPLATLLQKKGLRLLVSTTTETGQELAQDLFKGAADIFYFPLDLPKVCRRFIQKLSPDLILLTETEFWPNFIEAAWQSRVPVIVVNGRLSDRSFPRYRRAARLLKPILERISHFCMQSRQDKERILSLGVAPEKVNWVGNLKFDYHQGEEKEDHRLQELILRFLNGSNPDGTDQQLIWLCGSTREGEEELLVPVYLRLKEKYPLLRWIIVPRHPRRCPGVRDLLEKARVPCVLRSTLSPKQQNEQQPLDCIVVDTIGELPHLYPIADLVFIGGSLVPTGGQNPIEPAAFAKPILFGPHMENFREIAESFVSSYAALQVDSPDELQQRLEALIQDYNTRTWLGRNARKVIRSNKGALDRTAQIVLQHLPSNRQYDSKSLFSTL